MDNNNKNNTDKTIKRILLVFFLTWIIGFFSLSGVSWWLESSKNKIYGKSYTITGTWLDHLLIVTCFIIPAIAVAYVLYLVFIKKLGRGTDEKTKNLEKIKFKLYDDKNPIDKLYWAFIGPMSWSFLLVILYLLMGSLVLYYSWKINQLHELNLTEIKDIISFGHFGLVYGIYPATLLILGLTILKIRRFKKEMDEKIKELIK